MRFLGSCTMCGLLIFWFVGCSDTDLAAAGAIGKPAHIQCFSGSSMFYEGDSTGKVATVANSDGWEFMEQGSRKFVRVSGPCLIKN